MPSTSVTYFVVQPFRLSGEGYCLAEDAQELPSAAAALRRAKTFEAPGRAAIAFSRTGDPQTGDWGDAVILGQFGALPEEAIEMAKEAA